MESPQDLDHLIHDFFSYHRRQKIIMEEFLEVLESEKKMNTYLMAEMEKAIKVTTVSWNNLIDSLSLNMENKNEK